MASRCKKQVKFSGSGGDHTIAQCNQSIEGRYIHHKPARAVEGKPIIQVFDSERTRELIVPNREPTELPAIWPLSEFERLKRQAHVVTTKERLTAKQEVERQRQQLRLESEQRKEALERAAAEQKAKAGSKLSQVETEAAEKNNYVLQRAFELRQEQEDEIKRANSLILATKCLAVREAQIIEHELIEKEKDDENRRLDEMMEQRRQMQIKAEVEKKHKKELNNQRYVKEVAQQIRENEIGRMIEAEAKEEESRNMNKALIAMQQEDQEKIRLKRLENHRRQQDLKRCNEEIEHYKIVQREEQRIADMRVQEFMRAKAEREAAREAELAAQKAAKELEIARMREAQESAAGRQAEADELNALRVQEQVEKEWREKERSAALRRKQQAEEMRQGRERQIEDQRRAQALEIEKERQEFHQVALVQNQLYQRDLSKKREKRQSNIKHRKELLLQINEKEKERIQELRERFDEGTALRLEQEIRTLQIGGIMKKKVQRLRDNKVPENYVKDVERALKLV